MKKLILNSLTRRFLVLVGAFVLFTAYSSQSFFARQERTNLETRLREKASFINNFYAFLIADALVRKDDITLQQVVNRLEEDQEITSVLVADQRGMIRYNRDAEKVGLPTEDPAIATALKTGEAVVSTYENSGGRALALLTPLKVQGLKGPLGAIRIDLTHRYIEKQVTSSRRRFWFVIAGSLITCAGFVTLFVKIWVLTPLDRIRSSVSTINPSMPDAAVMVLPDEFGEMGTAMNTLLEKIKAEIVHQTSSQTMRGEREKEWIRQLTTTFLPHARVLIADKDNRVISDSGAPLPKGAGGRAHLLDLIADKAFAALLTTAFEAEGKPARGPVTFQEKPYQAMILSVAGQQSVAVKTIIALLPN